jgi:hypothetical protein
LSHAAHGRVAAPSLPLPPAPLVGSPRYFALLYTQPPMCATLTTLLALADEISAGAGRGLDHSVAHARLDWWRMEAERYVREDAQHPWLRALLARQPGAARLNLQPLLEAAAIDLATQALSVQPGTALQGAVFRLAAAALRAAPGVPALSSALQQQLDDLGQRTCQLERSASGRVQPLTSSLEALRRQAEGIEAALQPQLAPLLVWVALAARQAQRRARSTLTKSGSGRAALADNIAAWRAARRALRGRFRIG